MTPTIVPAAVSCGVNHRKFSLWAAALLLRLNIKKELITIEKTTEKRKSESKQTLKLKEQTNKFII